MKILAFALFAFVLFWVIASSSDRATEAHRRNAIAAFDRGLQPGAPLSTPEAFQAACGKADFVSQYKQTVVLGYKLTDLRVTFIPGHAVALSRDLAVREGGRFHDVDQPIGSDIAFGGLRCSAR